MIQFDAVWLVGLTTIKLPIIGTTTTEPYQVSYIEGLGPPELNVLLVETHAPGGLYVNRRAQGREIVARIGLNPDYTVGQTVADLRYALYGLLSTSVNPKDQSIMVQLIKDNVPQVQTQGYIRRIEIVPFNKKPEVQLTIGCLSPYLDEVEIHDIVDDIPGTSPWTFNNPGLAPTGIEFEIEIVEETSIINLDIENSNTGMDFRISVADWLQPGDVIVVDTNEATRFAGLKRAGEFIHYLDILTPESDWFTLLGGEHTMVTSWPGYFNWLKFQFVSRHWGI